MGGCCVILCSPKLTFRRHLLGINETLAQSIVFPENVIDVWKDLKKHLLKAD